MSDLEFRRGDTQVVKFELKDGLGRPVQLSETDKLYFTVKQNSSSKKVLLQKKFPENIEFQNDFYVFVINEDDTSNLNYGTYEYDIELKTGEYVKTLIMGTLTLTDEITFKGDE